MDGGILLGVLLRGRLLGERPAEDLEHLLKVRARVGLQRGEHLVQLDRGGGLADADRGAVVDGRTRRRSGTQVDEEVALEEDARADLHGGVLVNGERPVLQLHRHHRRVGVLVSGDPGDLSDVDARDPHRRVLADRHGRREHALHAEPVRERDVLGESEVHPNHDDDEHHGAGRERVHPGAVLAEAGGVAAAAAEDAHPFFAPLSVVVLDVPGALPITVWPAA